MNNLENLYSKFELERLKRYLDANPDKAKELAIAHFSDYLELAKEYVQLEAKTKSSDKPSLFPISNQNDFKKLQADYEELLDYSVQLERQLNNVKEYNRALRQLLEEPKNPSFNIRIKKRPSKKNVQN
ncbi:MAG: hypothetical protein QNJ72_13660 [Pleurocapsa sp. MO_226.B13]|nr:hypothetical protein [Pleurocapsa sp. MO_226.B13]